MKIDLEIQKCRKANMPEYKTEKIYDVGTSNPIVARMSLQMMNLMKDVGLRSDRKDRAGEICFKLMEKFLEIEQNKECFLKGISSLPGFEKSKESADKNGDFSKLAQDLNRIFDSIVEIEKLFLDLFKILSSNDKKDLYIVESFLKNQFNEDGLTEIKITGERGSLESIFSLAQKIKGHCLSVTDIKIEERIGHLKIFSKSISEDEPLDIILPKLSNQLFEWLEHLIVLLIIANHPGSVLIKIIPDSKRNASCPIKYEIEGTRNTSWLPYFGYYWWEPTSTKDIIDISEKDISKRRFYINFYMERREAYKADDSQISLQEERIIHQESRDWGSMDIKFFKNEQGRLRMISCRVEATKKQEVLVIAYNSILRLLGLQSFFNNIPTSFIAMSAKDERNKAEWKCISQRHSPSSLYIPKEANISREFEILLSIYREAKNSQSPYYRFLCYYKIIEAFYRHRHIFSITDRIIKEKNLSFKRPKRKITRDMIVKSLIIHRSSEFENLSYGSFFEKLTHNERLMVAHVFPDKDKNAEWANLSDYDLYCEFVSLGNLTDLVVRDIIYDEIELNTKIHMAEQESTFRSV